MQKRRHFFNYTFWALFATSSRTWSAGKLYVLYKPFRSFLPTFMPERTQEHECQYSMRMRTKIFWVWLLLCVSKMSTATGIVKQGLQDLKDEITCPVCQEFFQEPKILPCFHYYCKQCVLQLAAREHPAGAYPGF